MFHLYLLMIILGNITVQGASLGNQQENPLHVHAKRTCDFCVSRDVVGCGFTGSPCAGSCPMGKRCCCYSYGR
ncbi:small cysteine-rich protein 1-like [Oculina patagonica]